MTGKNILNSTPLFVTAIVLVTGNFFLWTQGGSIDVNDGLYVAQWSVDQPEPKSVITVDVTARTTGYVGFGVSPNDNMTNADLYICGYRANNQTNYGWDMHGVGNIPPVMDMVNDYNLISASENETHTTVRFSRLLQLVDANEDVNITNSVQYILWSIGEIDELYHHPARGVLELNLLA